MQKFIDLATDSDRKYNLECGIHIKGSNRWIKLDYATPEWTTEPEAYFNFQGTRHYLSNIMRVEKNAPEWLQEYHGYMNYTFSSGIVVIMGEDPYGESAVKVYYWYSV